MVTGRLQRLVAVLVVAGLFGMWWLTLVRDNNHYKSLAAEQEQTHEQLVTEHTYAQGLQSQLGKLGMPVPENPITSQILQGPAGAPGAAGAAGVTGAVGPAGPPGKDPPCLTAPTLTPVGGPCTGNPGQNGTNGSAGAAGPPGPPGPPNTAPETRHNADGSVDTCLWDSSTSSYVCSQTSPPTTTTTTTSPPPTTTTTRPPLL